MKLRSKHPSTVAAADLPQPAKPGQPPSSHATTYVPADSAAARPLSPLRPPPGPPAPATVAPTAARGDDDLMSQSQ